MKNRNIALLLAAGMLLGLLTGCWQWKRHLRYLHAFGGSRRKHRQRRRPLRNRSVRRNPPRPKRIRWASAGEMTTVEEVVEEGMTPVSPSELKDGWRHEVEMKSSSSMFKVDRCELRVENGTMRAVLYMTSQSYLYLYAGTAEEAAAASEEDYVPREDARRRHGQLYPAQVEALDTGISCAAFSKKREKWYDRTLLFRGGFPASGCIPGGTGRQRGEISSWMTANIPWT